MIFIKLTGRLFSEKSASYERPPETSKALRLFLDTILAMESANPTPIP